MTTRIKVGIRVRPFLEQELDRGYTNSRIEVDQETKEIKVIEGNNSKSKKAFKFDYVFGQEADQNEVYTQSNVDSLLTKAADGYHCTLFAYGQTGSGKTHTMEGYEYEMESTPKEDMLGTGTNTLTAPMSRPKPKKHQSTTRFGIVPRAVSRLFQILQQKSNLSDFNVSCSFLQIYNEKIFDLLNPSTMRQTASDGTTSLSQGLRLRWSAQDQFQVENLFVCECKNAEEVMNYYNFGIRNRVTASHKLNMASSRSHTILSLRIETVDSQSNASTFSRIQLVDLAGSERIGQTGTEGKLAKESIDINKSLFILRQVITTLSEIHRSKSKENSSPANLPHIPYRESKLTSLLKQSIGGNSYSLMLACINPCDDFIDENLSTLHYATKATYIKNEPVLNNDPKNRVISDMKVDLKNLRIELDKANQHIDFLSTLAAGNTQNQLLHPHPPKCCSANCRYRLNETTGTNFASEEGAEQYAVNNQTNSFSEDRKYKSPSRKFEKELEMQTQQIRSSPMVGEAATNFSSINNIMISSPGANKIMALQEQVKRFQIRQGQTRKNTGQNNEGDYDSFSDRLMESISMVRDLLASNKQLRESTDIAIHKAQLCERDVTFLQRENQDLRDKIQNAGISTGLHAGQSQFMQSTLGGTGTVSGQLENQSDSKQMMASSELSNWSRFSKQDIIQEVLTLRQEKRVLERKVFGTEIEQAFNTTSSIGSNSNYLNGLKLQTQSPNLNHLSKRRGHQYETPNKPLLQPVNLYTMNSSTRKQYNNNPVNSAGNTTSIDAFNPQVTQEFSTATNPSGTRYGQSSSKKQQYTTLSPTEEVPFLSYTGANLEESQFINNNHMSTPKRQVQSQAGHQDILNLNARPAFLVGSENKKNRSTSLKQYPSSSMKTSSGRKQ